MKFKELKFMKNESESFKRLFVTYSKIKPFFGLFQNIVSKKRLFSYSFIGKAVAAITAADASFEVKPIYLSNFLSID